MGMYSIILIVTRENTYCRILNTNISAYLASTSNTVEYVCFVAYHVDNTRTHGRCPRVTRAHFLTVGIQMYIIWSFINNSTVIHITCGLLHI